MSDETEKDHLTLKWGTLKSWSFASKEAKELLDRYFKLGVSISAACQKDTTEQKEILCKLIDVGDFEDVYLAWDGVHVSKEEAKKYVMEYR